MSDTVVSKDIKETEITRQLSDNYFKLKKDYSTLESKFKKAEKDKEVIDNKFKNFVIKSILNGTCIVNNLIGTVLNSDRYVTICKSKYYGRKPEIIWSGEVWQMPKMYREQYIDKISKNIFEDNKECVIQVSSMSRIYV